MNFCWSIWQIWYRRQEKTKRFCPAWIRGRDYVVPEDIKTVAGPVMAHRLVLSRGFGGAVTGQTKIEEILGQVSVPTEEWER